MRCVWWLALAGCTSSMPPPLGDPDATVPSDGGADVVVDAVTKDVACACDADAPFCDGMGRCLACTGEGACDGGHCVTDPLAPWYGQCVACLAAAHCGPGKVCDPEADFTCVARPSCVDAGSCAPKTCDAVTGSCRCTKDSDCSNDPKGSRCDVASGICVACLSKDDCGFQNGGCYWGACGNCGSDLDCPGTQRCNPTGMGVGYCGCRTNSDCAGNAPQCLGAPSGWTGTCGCCAVQQCPMGTTCSVVGCPNVGLCVPLDAGPG